MQVFTTSNKQNEEMFKFIFKFEKIPKSKQAKKREECKKRFAMQNKKFKDKIFLIKNIKAKLNYFLAEKYKVAVCLAVFSKGNKQYLPHWVVAYKFFNNKYYFMDSAKGLDGYRMLSDHQLSRAFKENKKMGFPPALVVISSTPHQ
jgi:hypothetical protein